jgi:hypothetical protein
MQRIDKISFFTLCFTLIVSGLYAQTQDSYEYSSEFTWGINKNTSGGLIGGLVFKKARKLKNEKVLETFGLEIMNVKHPQEVKRNSIQTGNLFIYGKSNYLYALRLQYGRDIILFKKAPHQGVEIKGRIRGWSYDWSCRTLTMLNIFRRVVADSLSVLPIIQVLILITSLELAVCLKA